MSLPFPNVKPTSRNFKQGQFPTKVYRSLSGATVKRSFGNRAFGNQIELEFANIDDATATLILKHYADTSGGFERFTLPAEVFIGMSASLQGYIQSTATIRWEYAGPPDVESVPCGLNVVRVSLVGELI
jgi:hypothetical protein